MKKLIGGMDFDELRRNRIQNYDTITLALDESTVDRELTVTGNYLYIAESSDIDNELSIRFNEQSRKQIRLVHGRAVRTPFYRLFLSWTAQAGQTVTVAIGVGQDDVFEIDDIGKALELTGAVGLSGAKGTPSFNQVAVTNVATLIKAANSDRRGILVQNLDPVNDLYIGYDNTVTTANGGFLLKPFAAVELYFNGTIYGIRSAGNGGAGYLEEAN